MGVDADGMTRWDGPGLDAWEAWSPAEVAERLVAVDVPWCVVGGWAVDLAAGRQTREHEDLEIEILRPDLPVVRRALAPHTFHAVDDGEVRRLAEDEETPPEKHQNWVLDRDASRWRVDVMLASGDRATWRCRRHDAIVASRAAMVGRSVDGVPYLRPHGVILYKAKASRPKDEADLVTALPFLDDDERVWLIDALELAHPGHPWIDRVRSG